MKNIFLIILIISASTNSLFAQWTTSGSDIYNSNSGNVGIGTASPAARLDVHTSTQLGTTFGSNQLLMRVSGISTNYFMNNLWLTRDNSGYSDWLSARLHDGISIDGSYLTPGNNTRTWWERAPFQDIQLWGNANQTYMALNAGKLGLGTTSPSALLHLMGTPTIRFGFAGAAEGYAGEIGGISFYKHYDLNIAAKIYSITNWGTDQYQGADLRFATSNNNLSNEGLTDRMSILSNGNVGIGTLTPDYKLTVYGGIRSFTNISGDSLQMISSSSLTPEIQGLRVIAKTTNNKFAYGLVASAITSYDLANTVTAYGIYATAIAPSSVYGSFAGMFNGNLGYTGSFFHVSDKQLKENIEDLPTSLDIVLKLKPKTFSYKKIDNFNLPLGNQVGFIAQDVRDLLPALVNPNGIRLPNLNDSTNSETKIEKYLMLDYIGLIPYIVKSIQDQQVIIEKQSSLLQTILLKDSIESTANLTQAKVPHIVKLYPNPAQTQLDIECFTNGQIATIYVYNKDGKVYKSFTMESISSTISLESFENGVYLVALFVNGTAFDIRRFIVSK